MKITEIENILGLANLLHVRDESSYTLAKRIHILQGAARSLARVDSLRTSGVAYTGNDAYKSATFRIYTRITPVLGDLKFFHQSDPRGASLYIAQGAINPNNYATTAFAVL